MRIIHSLFLITLFHTTYSAAVFATNDDGAISPANSTDFIRTSCETTLYPDLCYNSLSGYASAVQQDPSRLAVVAVGVSLSRAKRMSLYLSFISHQAKTAPDPRVAAAIRDCFSVFDDAVDQIRGSLKEMRGLTTGDGGGGGGGGGEEQRLQISNVQTWMSAALTNEETCTDGFEGVADGPMKIDVCNRTVGVKEVTSNALALVNSLVANLTTP